MSSLLVEQAKILVAAVPVNTTGAAVAGDWFDLSNYRRICFIIVKGAWAGGTPAVTVNQATDNSGTSSKAVPFDTQFKGTALTNDVLATTAVSSNTFNLSATANEYHCIEVNCKDLDVNNGFKYVQLAIASPGSNADLVCVVAIMYDGQAVAKPDTLTSVID